MTDASASGNASLRAVIYTRKSDDPKARLRSVEEQDAECTQQCEREGWTIAHRLSDNDRSGSRHARGAHGDRPGYRAVQELIRRGEVDILVMWEGSRAQRDLKAYVKLRELCARHGVRYSYSGRVYDLTRSDDRFVTGLHALQAEYESDVIRDRVLRGMRANATAGKPHGKLLYGYTRRYDERGELVEQSIREDQAAIVREAAGRIARGDTAHSVAMDLNARGILAPGAVMGPVCDGWETYRRSDGRAPCEHGSCGRMNGGRWDLTAVRRMVTNPAYAGHRVHLTKEAHERKPGAARPIVAKATWPAILDEITWSRCVALFADPGRKRTRDVSMRWLLSNIATAERCGAPLRVSRGGSEDAAHYVCSKDSCVSIRAIGLDTYVWMVLTDWLSEPGRAEKLAPESDDDGAATALAEAAEKRERLQGFYALAARGGLTPDGIAAIEAQLLPEIEDAERRSREASSAPALAEVLTEVTAAPDPARALSGLPAAIRRDVVRLLVEVRVKPAGKGARYRDPDIDDPELARIDPARVIIERRKR